MYMYVGSTGPVIMVVFSMLEFDLSLTSSHL